MTLRRTHSGFTLLELILAMAMAALLSLTLYTALNTAIRARRTAQNAVLSSRAGSIALDIICRDLDCAFPPPASDGTTLTLAGPFQGSHQSGNGGDNDDIVFSTLSHDELNETSPLSDGICTVEYFIQADNGTPSLVRRVTRNLLASTQTPGVDEVLCHNVRAFSMQYYDGTTWQNAWDSTQQGDVLPPAVMVTIDIQSPTSPTPNQPPTVQRLTRVIPLACAKPPATTTQ